jgi:hypothetical protein
VAGSCDDGNGASGKKMEFLNQMSDYQLFKEFSSMEFQSPNRKQCSTFI